MWLNRNKGSFLGTVKTNTLKDCVTVFIVECYLFGFVWHCGEAAGPELWRILVQIPIQAVALSSHFCPADNNNNVFLCVLYLHWKT